MRIIIKQNQPVGDALKEAGIIGEIVAIRNSVGPMVFLNVPDFLEDYKVFLPAEIEEREARLRAGEQVGEATIYTDTGDAFPTKFGSKPF